MNANDMRSAQNALRDSCGGSPDSFACGRAPECAADEPFSRRADHDWKAKLRKFGQTREQFEILRVAFPEADSRIEDDLRFFYAAPRRALATAARRPEVTSCITFRANGIFCMVLRFASHVHQYQRELSQAGDFGDARPVSQRGDVIQNLSACVRRRTRHFGLAGIHRNWNFEPPAQRIQHRENSPQFFARRNLCGAGASGFRADIENVRTAALYLQGASDGSILIEIESAIGEAVVGDVEHTHDQRSLAECERARRQPKPKFFTLEHSFVLGTVSEPISRPVLNHVFTENDKVGDRSNHVRRRRMR